VNKIGPSLVGVVGPQELVRTGTTARRCWRADGTAPRSPLGTARVWMPFHVATRRRAISGGANRTMDGRLSVRSAVNSLMIGSPDLDDPVSLLERRSSHCINGTSRTQMHIASSRREGQLSSNLRASSEPISLRENPEQADKAMKLQCRNVPTGALARLALKRGRLFAGSAKHFGFRTNVISSTGRSLSPDNEIRASLSSNPSRLVLLRTFRKLLARACEVPLLDGDMLDRNMEIAHPPLQRRTCVDRCAAAKRETRIDGANEGGVHPCRSLQSLHGLQGTCTRWASCDPDVTLREFCRRPQQLNANRSHPQWSRGHVGATIS
jgi:hypothetical protein